MEICGKNTLQGSMAGFQICIPRLMFSTWVFPKIGVFLPPKSSILVGFSTINHPISGNYPIFGNTHILTIRNHQNPLEIRAVLVQVFSERHEKH